MTLKLSCLCTHCVVCSVVFVWLAQVQRWGWFPCGEVATAAPWKNSIEGAAVDAVAGFA